MKRASLITLAALAAAPAPGQTVDDVWVELGSSASPPELAQGIGGVGSWLATSHDIDIGSDGLPIVAWTHHLGAVRVQKWNGNAWLEVGDPGTLRPEGVTRTASSVIRVDSSGIPTVAFGVFDSDHLMDIVVARVAQGSWAILSGSDPEGLGMSGTPGVSRQPTLSLGPDGNPIVGWTDFSTGVGRIYVRRWTGSSWTEVGSRSASGEGVSGEPPGQSPQLMADPLGQITLAWESGDEIFVRRWDGIAWAELGAGSASGGGVSDSGGNAIHPALALAPSGDPVLAWAQGVNGVTQIYAKRWNGLSWGEIGVGSASGQGISATQTVSLTPAVAVDPTGNPVIAWEERLEENQEIYVRRFDGSRWEEIGSVSASGSGVSETSGASTQPRVAVDNLGWTSLAWQDETPDPTRIYGSIAGAVYVRRADGDAWQSLGNSSETVGGVSQTPLASRCAAVAVDSDGHLTVVWAEAPANGLLGRDGRVFARYWDGVGWQEIGQGSARDEGIISQVGAFCPLVCMDTADRPIVAWTQGHLGNEPSTVCVRRWNGELWEEMGESSATGGGVSQTNALANLASLTSDTTGSPVLAWRVEDSVGFGIELARWDGTGWQRYPPFDLGRERISMGRGSLALDSTGQPVVVWRGETSPDSSEILGARWTGTSWVGVADRQVGFESITQAGGSSSPPSVRVMADGVVQVFWTEWLRDLGPIVCGIMWSGSEWVGLGRPLLGIPGTLAPYAISLGHSPTVSRGARSDTVLLWENDTATSLIPYIGSVFALRWNGISWTEVGQGSSAGSGISGSRANADDADIGIDPLGNPVVVWTETETEIYLRATGPGLHIPGSVNGDTLVNAADLIALLNHLDGTAPITYAPALANANLDADGDIDADDVAALIDLLLGRQSP